MKKTYSLFFVFMTMISLVNAQNTCSTPYPISSDATYTFPLVTNTPNNDSTNYYGCITSPDNPTWMYFQVCQAGSVDLTIGGSTSTIDVDYIVYGPLNGTAQCALDSSLVVTCGPATGTANIMFNTSFVGSYYKIMIANFSNSPGGIIVNSSAPFNGAIFDTICSCTIPPVAQSICQVTTDPSINHNIVIWEKDPAYLYDYIIEKETTTMGVYSSIATIPNGDSSAYEDVVSNPMIQSFKYRILTTDSCGQFTAGAPHTTIHLLTTLSAGAGYPQLSWNAYAGFNYGSYFIYRGTSPTTLNLYDSISASFTSYTDVNPASGLMYYSIAVSPPSPCQPSRSTSSIVFSNTASIMAIGVEESDAIRFTLGPNPASYDLTVNFAIQQQDGFLDLMDISGRSVFQQKILNTSSVQLNVSEISDGYYFIRLSNSEGSSQRKIIISR